MLESKKYLIDQAHDKDSLLRLLKKKKRYNFAYIPRPLIKFL